MHEEISRCPVETTLGMIGEKWKVLILFNLLNGTMRFGEIKRALDGISQKVLTHHLRAMEEDGILSRKVYAEVPPRVEYSLTPTGMTLKPIIDTMALWGIEYLAGRNNK